MSLKAYHIKIPRRWTLKPRIDLRYKNENDLFRVDIRAYSLYDSKRIDVDTGLRISEKQYEAALNSENPRTENKKIQEKVLAFLMSVKLNAENSIGIKELKDHYKVIRTNKESIYESFLKHYQKRLNNNQISQAAIDKAAVESILDHVGNTLMINVKEEKVERWAKVPFTQITGDVLRNWQISSTAREIKPLSETTIAIYSKAFRSFWRSNSPETVVYPFSRSEGNKSNDGFKIPHGNENHRALSIEEMRTLIEFDTNEYFNQRAKDIFLLSFYWHGANMSDICTLKWSDQKDKVFQIKRDKNRTKTKKMLFYGITDATLEIMEKYKGKGDYVFNFLDKKATNFAEIKRQVSNFTRNINDSLKKIAQTTGIGGSTKKIVDGVEVITWNLSTMYARHTRNTMAANQGEDFNIIQQSNQWKSPDMVSNYIGSIASDKLLKYQSNAENLYKDTEKKSKKELEQEAKILEYEKIIFELKKG